MNNKKKEFNYSNFALFKGIKKYFKFDTYGAILKKEIIGGITTFLAMCYILSVNPSIVGSSPINPTDLSVGFASQYQAGLFLTTAISSFLATMFMGLWARVPVALAPGMGLNAFFAFTVAQSVGFESALSITILSGIFYLIIAVTPLRNKITKAIPTNFKIAIGAGIGLFIAFLGLQNAGIIAGSENVPISKLGDFTNPLVILAICLIILGLILHFAKVPGAMIITILLGAIILIILCVSGAVVSTDIKGNPLPNYGLLGDYSDFSSFPDVAKAGWLGFANPNMWTNPMTYIGVLSFLYMDFFDTTGSLIVINRMIDLDKRTQNWMVKANQVDAISTIVGAGIGATTVTSFVESTTGVAAGAKTGLASVVTALCFGLSIAIWPIMKVFMPINNLQPISSVALVVVGAILLTQIRNFEWEIFADIPMLFITIIMMTLTNSIAHGLSFGMICFVLMNGSLGMMQKIRHHKKVVNDLSIPISDTINEVKTREFNYIKRVNWTCIIIAIISLAYIIIESGFNYANWFK